MLQIFPLLSPFDAIVPIVGEPLPALSSSASHEVHAPLPVAALLKSTEFTTVTLTGLSCQIRIKKIRCLVSL